MPALVLIKCNFVKIRGTYTVKMGRDCLVARCGNRITKGTQTVMTTPFDIFRCNEDVIKIPCASVFYITNTPRDLLIRPTAVYSTTWTSSFNNQNGAISDTIETLVIHSLAGIAVRPVQ